MVVVLDQTQAVEVRLLAESLGMSEGEVVRHLLSGPLARWEGEVETLCLPR